jgi:hypothetical protein
MRSSKDRIALLARTIVAELTKQGSVRLLRDPELVRQAVANTLTDELRHDDERDTRIRIRIASALDAPPPSSKEWDAIYRKLFAEEYEKRAIDSD